MIHKQREAKKHLRVILLCSMTSGGTRDWRKACNKPVQEEVKFHFDSEIYCWGWGLMKADSEFVVYEEAFNGAPLIVPTGGGHVQLKIRNIRLPLRDEDGSVTYLQL
jgi:hypothetical protein